jgi:HlyD family secretion protein
LQDWESVAKEFGGTTAATRPCKDAKMSFAFSTEVLEIPVQGGQRVKKGDLLIRARDSEVKTAIDQQRALAENDLEVQGAEKQLELATITFENIKKAGPSPQEFDQRRIEADVARVQRDQAKFNREQQRLKLAQLEAQYERYRLLAPFDGVLDEVTAEVGQGVTEQDKVLRIVNIDKMWLDPTPPTAETIILNLAPGSKAWVLVDMPVKPILMEGRVLEISPVADSVSQTRRVRVEVDNPKGLPPGTQAAVRFVAPEGKWAAGSGSAAVEPGTAVAGGATPR